MDFTPFESHVIGIGGNATIQGSGTLVLKVATAPSGHKRPSQSGRIYDKFLTFKAVMLVEKSPVNLISMSAWTDEYPEHLFSIQGDMIKVSDSDGSAIACAEKIGERPMGNAWHLIGTVNTQQHAFYTRSLQDWHLVLGHADPRNIKRLSEMTSTLRIARAKDTTRNTVGNCIGCIQGKSTVRHFPSTPRDESSSIADIIYSDVWGPSRTTSINGHQYFITFTDSATRFLFVFFMTHKNEAVQMYITFANWMRTQKTLEIKRIHFDNGKELVNKRLSAYCSEHGTEISTTAPYSSQQNGVAERANRTLAERARCMIHGHSNTRGKEYLWEEAVAYAALIQNNMPRKIGDEFFIPNVLMIGKYVDMKYFHMFGSTCHVLLQRKGQDKMGTKTKTAIFTGLTRNSGGEWRYLALPDRAIRKSRNVYFPRHLPDPADTSEAPPLGHSQLVESDIDTDNDWLEVELPSEGEKEIPAHTPETPAHTLSDLPAPTHPKPVAIAPEADRPSTPESEASPRLSVPAAPRKPKRQFGPPRIHPKTRSASKAAKNSGQGEQASLLSLSSRIHSHKMPAIRTTHTAALANSPLDHLRLKPSGPASPSLVRSFPQPSNFQSIHWLQDVAEVIDSDRIIFRDPESNEAYYYDTSEQGLNFDGGHFPEEVYLDLKHMNKNRHEELSYFYNWIDHNYAVLDKPTLGNGGMLSDNLSPKWSVAIRDPVHGDAWTNAGFEEMSQLIEQNVFDDILRTDVPPSEQVLGSMFVTKLKLDQIGHILRFKARLVVFGHQQIPGKSYNDITSNTPDMNSVRVVFVIVCHADMDCHMVDVHGAYTHAPIDRPLYVEYPEGFGKGGPTVMMLKKALYGAHQSGYLWEKYRNEKLTAIGYTANPADPSIFRRECNDILCILVCYVDDILICTTRGHVDAAKKEVMGLFDCRDLGEAESFLGIKITRDRPQRHLSLTMEKYIKSIVELAGLTPAKFAHSPMAHDNQILRPAENMLEEYPYSTMIGRLLWLARTVRPDIMFVVCLLARFTSCYDKSHIEVLKRTFRYIAGTSHIGIDYNGNGPFQEVCYTDSDYAQQHERKSIGGGIMMLGGGPVAWFSKKQESVATSTMEAEFYALARATSETLWLRNFLAGLHIDISAPSTILIDNQATIDYVQNPTHRTRAKHIDIKFHFVRDYFNRRQITLGYVPTKDNLADALTKPLAYPQHWYLANSFMGINHPDHTYALGYNFPHFLYEEDIQSAFGQLAH